jgi:hypothetical protein
LAWFLKPLDQALLRHGCNLLAGLADPGARHFAEVLDHAAELAARLYA